MDPDTYCREIEAYLCRKNDGHLVRVVGPAFQMVGGWAAQGIPFKVACRGIERYFERYYAKGPRRRPVRVEFCEADVLDAFDEWRRAVGIGMAGMAGAAETGFPAGGEAGSLAGTEAGSAGTDAGSAGTEAGPTAMAGAPGRHGPSLRAHLDRVVTRLTDLQASAGVPADLAALVGGLIDRLAVLREGSRTLRGDARQAVVASLEQMDGELVGAARGATAPETLRALREEAEEELSGYRARMSAEAYERALAAATDKLLREHWKLPTVAYAAG